MKLALPRLAICLILIRGALDMRGGEPVWRWTNPKPHGATIYDIASRGSLVVQVGELGQVYTSDDLIEWTPRKTGLRNSLRSAIFFGSRLVITASEGVILYADTLDKFTVVNLGTTNWIEGIASARGRLAAVGDNGAIYTSPDGAAWDRRPDAGEWLTSVAYGGGKFVAVGLNGFVISSEDGLTWSGGSRVGTEDLNSVAWIRDGFMAVGNGGTVITSATGADWVPLNMGTVSDFFGVAANENEVVVVGRSELRSSAAPYSTWASHIGINPPKPPLWTYLTAHWDGAEFLVGGRNGMFVEGFRPEGETSTVWFTEFESPRNWIWSLTRAGDIYAACGDFGGIFTSTDGYKFEQEVVPQSAQSQILEGIGGTSELLVCVGTGGTILYSEGGYTNVVSTNAAGMPVTNRVSLLGLVWNEVFLKPTLNELQGVGVFGETFIVTGANGTILTSGNGRSWISRFSGVSRMLSSVAVSETRAVVTGDYGTILTSDNGTAWTARASGVTNWIYQARHGGNQFVAVGEAGLILTSPDGVAWTRRESGTTQWLNTVAFFEGTYFVGGGQGTLLRSADGITWEPMALPTGKSIYGIAGGEGRLLIAGIEGTALRTRLLPWSTPVNFVNAAREGNAHLFLFSGEMDQRFRLQRTQDFDAWLDGAEIEILDNSGAQVFYDAVHPGAYWFFRTEVIQP